MQKDNASACDRELELGRLIFSTIAVGKLTGSRDFMRDDLERILFHEKAIHTRLDEMAALISKEYQGRELTVIAVLSGSLMFMADLLRRIPLPLKLDFLSVASYHGKTQTSGEVVFKFAAPNPSGGGQVLLPEVKDRHLLILDDILDSGHTLAAIREKLETAGPRSTRICVLLSKKKARARKVDADYVGFEIEDEFVVGYGLDFMEKYRNLPFIGVLRKDLIAQAADETTEVSRKVHKEDKGQDSD